jgi:hypothetical protein
MVNARRAIVFGLFPALGGWLEMHENPPPVPGKPFTRRPRSVDFLISALGLIVLLLGLMLGVRIVSLIGIGYVAVGLIRPITRALIPHKFAETEIQFMLLTSPHTLVRLGWWVLLALVLVNGQWIAVAVIGLLLVVSVATGFATLAIVQRARARKEHNA